ncbi:MAG: L-histidine N(alpha)-methyltransferase [Celeribacter sp.]
MNAFTRSLLDGLTATPKTAEAKWFYDAEGSALFERITELPEYYPTRTEIGILRDRLADIAMHVPDGAALIELGSGASVKTRVLLDGLDRLAAYVPIDISAEFLAQTARGLRRDYPALTIHPVTGDFMAELSLPDALEGQPKIGFFPGSTIGNLDRDAAVALLAQARRWPEVAGFVLGADLVKAPDVLRAAYDDAQGVTAAFNRNLLHRANREAGADFDPDTFAHEARWNEAEARVEMHLVSRTEQQVRVAGRQVSFAPGETIHTENSRKYTAESLSDMAQAAGWQVAELLTDARDYFAVAVLKPV